ncbi:MAG: hypothetical protein IJL66_02345 [Lachnospiraceae bacterium]|nr:hypothetical protein [Lachnospiraceae bacterium]
MKKKWWLMILIALILAVLLHEYVPRRMLSNWKAEDVEVTYCGIGGTDANVPLSPEDTRRLVEALQKIKFRRSITKTIQTLAGQHSFTFQKLGYIHLLQKKAGKGISINLQGDDPSDSVVLVGSRLRRYYASGSDTEVLEAFRILEEIVGAP